MDKQSPDEDRFVEWWARVQPKVFSLGRKFLSSPDAARDLTQDIALGALLRFHTFENIEHFEGWCMTRTRWLAIDRLRIDRRMRPLSEGAEPASFVPSVAHEDVDSLDDLFRAVGKLPEHQRIAITRKIEGYSTNAIARELGVTDATVRSLVRHARVRLSGIR